MTIRLKQFEHLGLRHLASTDWIEHIIKAVIPCICMYRTHVFRSTNILPHKQSMPHHSSNRMLPRHRLVPRQRTVYVNSVMNSIINSIVHVNNVIYHFLLLLRFLAVLSSELLSVFRYDLSYIVK